MIAVRLKHVGGAVHCVEINDSSNGTGDTENIAEYEAALGYAVAMGKSLRCVVTDETGRTGPVEMMALIKAQRPLFATINGGRD